MDVCLAQMKEFYWSCVLIESFLPRDVKARNKIGSKKSSNRSREGSLTESVWHVAKFR